MIKEKLQGLRNAGCPVTVLTARSIIMAIIENQVPELFQHTFKDGTKFACSETFVRKYLHLMGWSDRASTQAAQKLPKDHERLLQESFLREALLVRDFAIPAELRINTDQTQIVYQQGTKRTWNESGVKQVATVGEEEKRAFTLVP